MEEENDPFGFLITKLHISSSQEELLQNLAIVRENERFPNESESQSYNIPVEDIGIRMESPPEEEFLTPQEDSLSIVSSQEITREKENVVIEDPPEFFRDNRKNLEGFGGLEKRGFGGEKVFDEMDSGNEKVKMGVIGKSNEKDEFMVEKRVNLEGFEVSKRGDFGGEKVLDEVDTGNEKAKMGVIGNSNETDDLEEGNDDTYEFTLGKWKILEGLQESERGNFGSEKVLDEMDIGKGKVGTTMNGKSNKKYADLEKECERELEMGIDEIMLEKVEILEGLEKSKRGNSGEQVFDKRTIGNEKVEKGVIGNSSRKEFDVNEKCDLDENGVERGCDDDIISTQVLDLNEDESCGDLATRNAEVEICSAKSVATEVVDLSENETSGVLPMGNIEGEIGLNENPNMEVDINEDELYVNLPKKNLGEIQPREGDEIDIFKCISPKGVKEVCKIKSLGPEKDDFRPKGISIGGSSNVNKLPPRNQEAEIVLNEGHEPCIDEIQGNVMKGKGIPEGSGVQPKCKGQNGTRKLPSSLDMLAEIDFKEGNVSNRERNERIVEKNKHRNNEPKCFAKTSKGSCSGIPSSTSENLEDNPIMKNLLGALDIMAGKEKEKVNDVSDEEVDFLESAMDRGMFLPKPRWWPTEGFSDE